jgi:hypothetical protein
MDIPVQLESVSVADPALKRERRRGGRRRRWVGWAGKGTEIIEF